MIVCCIKVGDKYSNEYVVKLKSMCEHYLPPHLFVCITDDPTVPGPTVEAIKHPHVHTWWHKIMLFNDKPFGFNEKFLYLDLDVVFNPLLPAEDFRPFFTFDSDFAIIKDWNTGGYNSSVMLLKPGAQKQVYDKYMQDPVAGKNTLGGDQGFIELHAKADLWPEGWCVSYKQSAMLKPAGKIVVFHGKPNPHECDNWVQDAWR